MTTEVQAGAGGAGNETTDAEVIGKVSTFDEAFEPPRNERGQFKPREAEPQAGEGEQQGGERQEPEPQGGEREPVQQRQGDGQDQLQHRVPLSEHLSTRERAQVAERQLEEARREAAALRREMQGLRKPPPPPPDMIADPDGWRNHMQAEIRREFQTRFLNASFDDAADQHKDEFHQAYDHLTQVIARGDLALRDRIVNSHNPGRSLMRWHREQVALHEIGGDFDGYRQRVGQEAIRTAVNDPEFRKALVGELIRQARESGQTLVERPGNSNVTTLPSLTRTSGSAGNQTPGSLGSDDAERFNNAFAPARR